MATITFNGPALTITIGYDTAVTTVDAVDIYSAWKDWVALGNAQYLPAFAESVGGNELGAGVSLSGYYFLRNDLGWRIVPDDGQDYTLQLNGDLYPQDANTAFVLPPAGDYTVLVTFQRSAASYVVLGTGTPAPTAEQVATAVWTRDPDDHTSLTSMGGLLRMVGILGRNKTVTDPSAGTFTVYADDGTTVLFTADLFEDAAGTQPYRGQGAERRDGLV
jgi:hypothetical protein